MPSSLGIKIKETKPNLKLVVPVFNAEKGNSVVVVGDDVVTIVNPAFPVPSLRMLTTCILYSKWLHNRVYEWWCR